MPVASHGYRKAYFRNFEVEVEAYSNAEMIKESYGDPLEVTLLLAKTLHRVPRRRLLFSV